MPAKSASLAAPPRNVPPSLTARLYFGGKHNQFLWVAACVILLICWMLGSFSALFSQLYFSGDIEHAQGKVTNWEYHPIKYNEEQVYLVYYKFQASDGQIYEDYSYSSGYYYDRDEVVPVEYPLDKPSVSRIEGMRRTFGGSSAGLIMLVFIVVGIGLTIQAVLKARKAQRLLRDGTLAEAKLLAKREKTKYVSATGVSWSSSNSSEVLFPEYVMSFEFTAQNGKKYTCVETTREPEKLEDNKLERVLYLPDKPTYSAMLDNLPGEPEITPDGHFDAGPEATLPGFVAMMIMPTCVVVLLALALTA